MPMHAFLFTHLHWLCLFLHFMSGLHIYDWKTFWAFLVLGACQTFVAWGGGTLAVKGLGSDKEIARRAWNILFAVLGVALLLTTAVIGFLNDQGQHQAEVKTNDAVDREHKLQETANQQAVLLVQTNDLLSTYRPTAKEGESSSELLRRIEGLQRNITQLLTPKGSAPVAPAGDPLSKMSDAELQQAVTALWNHLRFVDRQMLDAQEQILRMQNAGLNPSTGQRLPDLRIEAETTRLNRMMTGIIQTEVPLVNKYRAELLRRLGANAGLDLLRRLRPNAGSDLPPVTPDVKAVDRFLSAAESQLSFLASRLPVA